MKNTAPAWIKREKLLMWLVLALALQSLLYMGKYMSELGSSGLRFGNDFTVFWNTAQFLPTHDWARIYAPAQPDSADVMPFVYPPPMLMLLSPFHGLPYALSVMLWLFVTGKLFMLAVVAWGRQLGLVQGDRSAMALVVLALLSPFVLVNLLSGQTGFLVAALLLGGLCNMPRNPWVAGAVLGAMVLKPQMMILLPVLLLATRQYEALAAMALSALLMAFEAHLIYGAGVWGVYPQALESFARLVPAVLPQLQALLVSFGPFAQAAGIAAGVVYALQLVCFAACAVLLWRFARTHAWEDSCALFCLLAFVAAPYAMAYDFAVLILPAMYFVACAKQRALSARERLSVAVLLLFPLIGVAWQEAGIPIYWLALAGLSAAMLRQRPEN